MTKDKTFIATFTYKGKYRNKTFNAVTLQEAQKCFKREMLPACRLLGMLEI